MTENKLFRRNIKAEAGRSMVEMLGVLAIIGVLSVGGISGYSKAMAKYKASKAMDQLSLLIANIRTAFSTVSNYGDLSNKTAAQYSIVSRDMYAVSFSKITTSSGLVNAFGGKLLLGGETYNTIENAGFFIQYDGLNPESCIQLATADWGTGGLDRVVVGSDEYKIDSMPVPLSAAYASCKGLTNTITWHFY